MYKFNIVKIAEIDSSASASYCAIHNIDKNKNLGDITKIDPKTLPKEINVLVGGSPCTSFSSAGRQDGSSWTCNKCGKVFDPLEVENLDNYCCPDCKSIDLTKTESSLIVDWLRIFKEVNPKLAIFENVKNLLSKRFEKSFKLFETRIQSFGYNTYYKCMNAKDYGIPQNRERVIFVAIRKDIDNGKFKFPEPCADMVNINDLLEAVPDVYRYSESKVIIDEKISPYLRRNIERDAAEIITSDKGIYRMKCESGFNDNAVGIKFVPTLRAKNSSTLALQTFDTLQGTKYYIKRLTPLEAFRFMGFTDEDYRAASKVNCKTQLYKQCGNSIVVPVIESVLRELFKAMPELFEDVKIIDLFAGIGAFEKAFKNLIEAENKKLITDETIELFKKGIPLCDVNMPGRTFSEQQCMIAEGYPELESFADKIREVSYIDSYELCSSLLSKMAGKIPVGKVDFCNYTYSLAAVDGLASLAYLVENIIYSEYETWSWNSLDESIENAMEIYYSESLGLPLKIQYWSVEKVGPNWFDWQMVEDIDEDDEKKRPQRIDLFAKWDKDFLMGLTPITCA